MSLKHLLYSLAWMVPGVGGMLSLCLLLCARHSLRAAHHYRPAFLLSALGVMMPREKIGCVAKEHLRRSAV